jgi:hypothetical protein
MGEGAVAPLINDSVDPYDRYEHVGEGVSVAALVKELRPPAPVLAHPLPTSTKIGLGI